MVVYRVINKMGQVEAGVPVGGQDKLAMSFSNWFSMSRFCGRRLFMSAFCGIELARHRIPDNRVQPSDDVQPAARMLRSRYWLEGWSNTDKSADDG